MALTPDEAKKLRDMLKEIEELSIKLKTNIDTTNLQDIEKNAKEIENLFNILNDRWKDLTKDVDIALDGFRDIVQEITKQNLGLKESTKSYSSFIDIGKKIQGYQREGANLTLKDLEKLKERAKLEKLNLENANKLLTERQSNLEKEKAKQEAIASAYQKTIDNLLQQDKLSKVQSDRLSLLEKLQEKQNQKVENLNDNLKQTKNLLEANQAVIEGNDESFNNLSLSIEETARQIKEKFVNELDTGFKNIIKEIQTTDDGIKRMAKTYGTLSSIAQQIQDHQSGSSKMTEHDAELLLDKLESQRKSLANNQKLLQIELETLKAKQESNKTTLENLAEEIKELEKKDDLEEKDLERLKEKKKLQENLLSNQKDILSEIKQNESAQEKILSIINKQDEGYNELVKKTKEIKQQQENLRKAMGLSGAAIDGIGNAFKKIGLGALADQMGLDKAKARMKEVAERITDGGKKSAGLVGQFRILGSGIASLGKSIMKNLTDPLVLAGLAAKAVSAGIGLIKKGFSLLKGGVSSVVGFVKSLWGMADQFAAVFEKYAKAGQFAAQNFSAIGGQVNQIGSGLKAAAAADPFMRVAEAGPALKTIVDGTGMFTTSMLKSVKSAHDLSYWLGYSAEETGELARLGMMQGKDAKVVLEDIKTQGILLKGQYKSAVDLRKVEQTALKASASVTYYLKQNPKALAEAAFHATKLSMTLDEINSAANATLDFESSISGQLAYQAISGRELNIDAYQQAKLRKDSVGMAKELNKLLLEHKGSLEESQFAQEEFARVTGMSVEKQNEAMQTMQLQNKLSAEAEDIERGIQYLMKEKNLSREKAAERLSKQDITNSLAASKRAEAMSRALEDFRDYMATRLWPLFKAIFSPANIKMFMAVINGMRPVFVELGKAITAFFSPKSAGAMTDVIKQDVMPAILNVAKAVTKIAGIFGGNLFNVIKEDIVPLIQTKLLPLVDKIGQLLVEFAPEIGDAAESIGGSIFDTIGGVIDTIMDNKDEIKDWLKSFSDTLKGVLSFAKDNIGEITVGILALKGFNLMKSAGVFDFAKSIKNVVMGSPGSERNPLYVRSVGGGGMDSGGGGGGGKWSDKSLGGKIQSTVATGAKIAAIGAASYTAVKALTSRGEEDVTQQEVEASKLSGSVTTKYDSKIEELQKQGAERLQKDEKQLLEKLYTERSVYDQSIYELQAKGVENLTNEEKSQLQQLTDIKKAYNDDINKLETKNLNTEELASLTKLKQQQDQDVKEQIVSSQYQTGSKTGDLMLAGTEAAAGLAINTGGGMGALAGGIKSMLGFGKKETPTPEVTPSPSSTPSSAPPTGGGDMSSGAVTEAQGNKNIISKTIDSIKEIFKSLISFVKDIGKEILSAVTEIIKGLGPVLNSVVDLAREVGTNILKTLTTLIKELEPVLMSVIDLAKNVGTNLLQTLTALLTEVEPLLLKVVEIAKNVGVEIIRTLGVFVDELKPVLMKIVDTVGEVGNALATEGMKIFNTIVDGLTQASNSLPTILGNLGKAIGSFFSGLGPGLVTFAELMATPTILFGAPVGLIVLAMANGLAVAARIAAPAIAALGPMFEGLSKVVEALAPVVEKAGLAIKYAFEGIGAIIESIGKTIDTVITSITNSITRLSEIDGGKLLSVAGGLGALSGALGAYGAGGFLSGIGNAIGEFFGGDPIEKFNRFAAIDAGKLNTVATAMDNIGSAIKGIGASAISDVGSSLENLGEGFLALTAADVINGISAFFTSGPVETLKQIETIDSNKMLATASSLREISLALQGFGGLDTDPITKAADALDKFNNQVLKGGLADALNKFLGSDPLAIFTQLSSVNVSSLDAVAVSISNIGASISNFQNSLDADKLESISDGIESLSVALAAYGAGGILEGIGSAIGEFFGGDPIAKFNSFAAIDADRLNAVAWAMSNIGNGIKSINPDTVNGVSNSIETLTEKLVAFFKHDFSNSKTIGQLKDLTTIDSSKIVTLAEAIDKLSNSFRDFGSTVSSLGNIDPVVKVTEHILNLHKSIVENPADESFGKKISDGLKSSIETVMTGLAGFFGLDVDESKDGIVHGKDAIVQVKDGGLNPNGGPVVSTFQQGQLKPVLQGIKEDNVYLTTNKPQSASTSSPTVIDNSTVVEAINRLTEMIASSNGKEIVLQVGKDELARASTPAIINQIKKGSISF